MDQTILSSSLSKLGLQDQSSTLTPTTATSTTAIATLSQLPDLALIAVLERLPLSDLLHLSLVCARWYGLGRHVLHTRHQRRLSLSIGDSVEEWRVDQLPKPKLVYPILTKETVRQLVATFRGGITSLRVEMEHSKSDPEHVQERLLWELIFAWAKGLKHFYLRSGLRQTGVDEEEKLREAFYHNLLLLLNNRQRMPELRTLDIGHIPRTFRWEGAGQLSVWGQLRHWKLCGRIPLHIQLDALEQYVDGRNERLEHFKLDEMADTEHEVCSFP